MGAWICGERGGDFTTAAECREDRTQNDSQKYILLWKLWSPLNGTYVICGDKSNWDRQTDRVPTETNRNLISNRFQVSPRGGDWLGTHCLRDYRPVHRHDNPVIGGGRSLQVPAGQSAEGGSDPK